MTKKEQIAKAIMLKLYNDKNRYDYFFKYYDDHCNDDGFSSDMIEKNNFAYIL